MRRITVISVCIMMICGGLYAQNCIERPAGGTGSICYGYAVSRAFGNGPGEASLNYRPNGGWIPALYFDFSPGTDFMEGDIVTWGHENVDGTQLSGSTGHAAYVLRIETPPLPEGPIEKERSIRMSSAARVRDNSPITRSTWGYVILSQVDGDGGSETAEISMLTVDDAKTSKQTPEIYKGFWRLKKQYRCATTFQNSIGTGVIYFGKDPDGSYTENRSGDTAYTNRNTMIPAKADSSHPKPGGGSYQLELPWSKDGVLNYSLNANEIEVLADANHAYTANFSGSTSLVSKVRFELQTDGLPLKSMLIVDGEIARSGASFNVGVTATALSEIMFDRVHYTFSHWTSNRWSGSVEDLEIQPNDSGTYVAHYDFDYILEPAYVSTWSAAVGEEIKLTWQEVTNAHQYVEKIEIWRKVKDVHQARIIDSLDPNATQFIDYAYVVTDGYTDNLIEYDIRLRYHTPVRTVLSPSNWLPVFGAEPGIFAQARKDEPEVLSSSTTPSGFRFGSYPNPFNPTTTVEYQLETRAKIDLTVFSLTGQAVQTISWGERDKGTHSVSWSAKDRNGDALPSGMYFLRISVHPLEGQEPFAAVLKLLHAK